MQFKQALKEALLKNPGRTTWCGSATDGTPVFTIWAHTVRQIGNRLFAADNVGRECRAVIVHRKGKTWEAASAVYPHPQMAVVKFRSADVEAIQFVAELFPPRGSVGAA